MTRSALLKRISRTAESLRALGSKTVEVTWSLAEDLVALQGTFPAGEAGAKAFRAAAATASGKGEGTITNLVRAIAVRDGLTAKQREAIEGWSYDMVLSLADSKLSSQQRTSLIAKVQKAETRSPIEVRKIKRTIVGGTKRTRQTSADATTKLAEKVREDVERCIANGHDPVALAAGARLARQYPTGDVAAAILFVAANVRTADKVVK